MRWCINVFAMGKQDIIEAIRASACDKAWQSAAGHFLGKGLEQGTPHLRPAKEARRALIKDGAVIAIASLLRQAADALTLHNALYQGGLLSVLSDREWCAIGSILQLRHVREPTQVHS